MEKTLAVLGALLVLVPAMALGQQKSGDKPQNTGKCWKVDMRSEADFYAKGWAKKNGFVGVVLLDDTMRYVKEERINEIKLVNCRPTAVQD
jgi:hypothetical protein